MQKVTPIYHLCVHCEDSQHEEYINFKHEFEKFFHEMNSQIQKSEQTGIAPHVSLFTKNSMEPFTFCIANKELYIGFFNKEANSIRRTCDFSELKNISEYDYASIEHRISNLLRVKDKDIVGDKALTNAWEREISQIKEKELAAEKRDEKSNVLPFRKETVTQSICTRSFDENCRAAVNAVNARHNAEGGREITKPLPEKMERVR